MSSDLEPVQFITTEIGDDLIVSFFVAEPQESPAGRSIILMRDRKWEHLVADGEKGVKISDEGFPEHEEVDNSLEAIRIDNRVAEIETHHRRYRLDLRRIDGSDLKAAKMVLKKMNYDGRFTLTIS